jgi:hypothetical protein
MSPPVDARGARPDRYSRSRLAVIPASTRAAKAPRSRAILSKGRAGLAPGSVSEVN